MATRRITTRAAVLPRTLRRVRDDRAIPAEVIDTVSGPFERRLVAPRPERARRPSRPRGGR